MIRSIIAPIISEAVSQLYSDAPISSFTVDEPATGIEADVSTNVALTLSKKIGRPPQEIAERILNKMLGQKQIPIKSGAHSPAGFINIILEDSFLRSLMSDIIKSGQSLAPKLKTKSNKVLIEFVSANPTGPLHIGHGRGASLGDSLARIYKQCGYAVETEYYVNDVGVQMEILSNSVKARAQETQGSALAFPENGYQGEYIRDIARQMLERKDENFKTYPKQYILNWIKKDLEAFGVTFDHWFSESLLHEKGNLSQALEKLKSRNFLKEKDGALWFQTKNDEDETSDQDRVLRKSDGRYTYFASDVAYHQLKFERGYDLCIDIWGHDHHGYVPRIESSLSALGIPKEKLKILLYQLVSLKRGGKRVAMSTRSGQFITLKEVVDEVGRDAARFFFALRSPNSQLDFDIDLAKKQSNENPVYYVQYVHARICSIFSEAEKRNIKYSETQNLVFDRALEKAERELIKKLGFFTDILEGCLALYTPHLLAVYLMELATKFHKFYDACRVLDAEPSLCQERLRILRSVQSVVKLGLSLIGVSAPERM